MTNNKVAFIKSPSAILVRQRYGVRFTVRGTGRNVGENANWQL